MASHILAQQPVYVDGIKATKQSLFPNTEPFSGFNRPSRIQGEIEDLEVEGTIPKAVEGTFYRIQSDHKYAPKYESDIHFNGDGIVGAFRISDGCVDWKQRYVETDRYKVEKDARKNLFGKYRNPYTDHPTVKGFIRTAANTNVFFWRGLLLALKEDGPPFALDPDTLATIGRYDFEGQVLSPTFTAHPKVDATTGELICFGYEAGGDGNDASKEVVIYTIGPDGTKREEAWYTAPYCGLIHDCGITENYVVLAMSPLKASLDRIQEGGNHWAWDPNEDQVYGIFPRHGGKREDAIWVRSTTAFHGHVAGAYEEDGNIIFDLGVASGNVFFFFPPEDAKPGRVAHRNKIYSPVTRWIFDPKTLRSGDWVEPAEECPFSSEFSRIDERYNGKKYSQLWTLQVDPTRPYDVARCGSPAGGLFNVLTHYNWETGELDEYFDGPCTTFQEPVFIPESDDAPEGHGYLMALMNRLDELRNDIGIFDARKLSAGPVAIIKLPLKFKLGFHGNWVDQREIDEFKKARESGKIEPALPAQKPLPWQLKQ
ncbi:putative carotenoid cleavage dioxygenase [Dactylonectria estremocensis]|uniref:Carotenoid cleavage dioxygenase n=1 Tax=Dactylonectria estremocensis TaxID=1079267 RepID=A0A9P9E717_9HYPO|nr:putative carotenoid cleavage dioxygenase [Dactylonectria estremocensis]